MHDELIIEDEDGKVLSDSDLKGGKRGGLMTFVFAVLGIFLLMLAVFVIARPSGVQAKDGSIDLGKASLAALIIALVAGLVIAGIRQCRK